MMISNRTRALRTLGALTLLAAALQCTAAQASSASAGTAGSTVVVTLAAPTHHPKVNVPWPLRVTVKSAAGKPLAASLTMVVLFGGTVVGTIDNGAVYHFVGSWQEKKGHDITWPADSRGEPLTLQVIVKAGGATVKKEWAIDVA